MSGGRLSKFLDKAANTYPVWRYVLNLRSTLAYKKANIPLSPVESRILKDLNANGIALTHVEELLGDLTNYKELIDFVERNESERKQEISEARKSANEISTRKDFIFQLLGDTPVLDPNDISVRFALQPQILNIVNGYFGCLTKLKFYNIWHTFVTGSGPKRSMLWHRDPEDKWIIKVFLYLSDVDSGAGPFTYAPATHPKGKIKKKPEWFKEDGRAAERSNDEQMEQVVPAMSWVTALGRKGTLIFADTRGYHKGGQATGTERIMYNCLFVSPASKTKEIFRREGQVDFDAAMRRLTYSQKTALLP